MGNKRCLLVSPRHVNVALQRNQVRHKLKSYATNAQLALRLAKSTARIWQATAAPSLVPVFGEAAGVYLYGQSLSFFGTNHGELLISQNESISEPAIRREIIMTPRAESIADYFHPPKPAS